MTRYLFDTNLFRAMHYSSDDEANTGTLTREQRVKVAVADRGDKIVASVESLYELIAHIRKEERHQYSIFRNALCVLLDYTEEQILDHTDYVLPRCLGGKAIHPSVVAGALKLCWVLRSIPRFEDLCTSPYGYISPGGIAYPLLTHLQMMRENGLNKWKAEWADGMINTAEQTFWPQYRAELASGNTPRITDKATRRKALETLDSPQTLTVMMAGMAARAGVDAPITDEKVFKSLSSGLCGFYCAHKGIWRKAIVSGYNFLKPDNMNDFIDMQLLMHLIEDDVVLVTNDGRLFKLVPPTCEQYGRVLAFEQLAESLGVA